MIYNLILALRLTFVQRQRISFDKVRQGVCPVPNVQDAQGSLRHAVYLFGKPREIARFRRLIARVRIQSAPLASTLLPVISFRT